MSRLEPTVIACPGCATPCSVRVFESLNADRIPVQVAAILDGSFERSTCPQCGAVFQPEHHMLYAHASARLWIVMYPVAARAGFAHLETEIAAVLARHFADAPGVLADHLRGLRPRLVFGHCGLAEAVRAHRDALDPVLLECTKLLAYRDNLGALLAHGPSELLYEGSADDARLAFAVRAFPSAERLASLTLPAKILGEARTLLPRFAETHAALFERPYISAARFHF